MLIDLNGYLRRNFKKWGINQKVKAYKEIKQIVDMMEQELNKKGEKAHAS